MARVYGMRTRPNTESVQLRFFTCRKPTANCDLYGNHCLMNSLLLAPAQLYVPPNNEILYAKLQNRQMPKPFNT
jgi:hypothetical protein